MIEGLPRGAGVPRANAHCDECERSETVTCDYERKATDWLPNEGQIVRKLQSYGWSQVKGVLRCPKCEARRKQKGVAADAKPVLVEIQKEPELMAQNVTSLREPTSKQIRLIILALEDAYDDTAKRYRGAHTDKSIAQEIGDAIMPGWVAHQREKLFGPAGNEELAKIKAEVNAVKADFASKISALEKRIASCVESHDKRVSA